MVRWSKTLLKILRELDYPPVFLVPDEQFRELEGDGVEDAYGISSDICVFPIYALHKGMRGKVLANVIYHELGHKLFPHRKHWWVECFAEKMAKGGGRGYYSSKYEHTPDDLPARERLEKIAKKASERLKQEYVKKKQKTRKKNRS